MTLLAQVLLGGWFFLLGATVGSFANVCIYRIALQKSVIWPGSRCPRCFAAIRSRDNVPILGWILLRGKCRSCGLPISARYPLIEALCGALFVAVYLSEIVYGGGWELHHFAGLGHHLVLLGFLIVATFIDYDYYILPDSITVTGMAVGLALGTVMPYARPDPGQASTAWDGFVVGLTGLLVGGAMIWAIRILGHLAFRREAMGFGDVTLMAMIGSFLGWQILPPTLFLAAILGLVHALVKLVNTVRKLVVRRQLTGADREIPFGPYLSMAALILMLAWPWAWPRALGPYYTGLGQAFRFLTTREF